MTTPRRATRSTRIDLNTFDGLTMAKTVGVGGNKYERINMLAEVAGSLHVGLAALGSALAVGIIGMKASEAVGRNPGASGKILTQAIISSALAEGIVFFAIFLVAK